MPKLDTKELQIAIDDGRVVGLTIDTSIFDQFECNLQFKALTALEQLKGTRTPFVLSPVTIGEVRRHIAKKTGDAKQKATEAINQFLKAWRSEQDLAKIKEDLALDQDPERHAEDQMVAYLKRTGAISLGSDISVPKLLSLYFSSQPPFSNKEKKKSEFPDGIALLALETWAEKAGGYVLAVSRDADWKSYAEGSQRLVCIENLPQALTRFNLVSTAVAAKIADLARREQLPDMFSVIERKLESYIEDFDIEAQSGFVFDEEAELSNVVNWSIPGANTFDILDSDEHSVTVGFEVELEAEFGAKFRFSVRDSVDGDYVPMGAVSETKTEYFWPYVIVTMNRDVENKPDPIDVEVDARGITVDFGYVEPDWDRY